MTSLVVFYDFIYIGCPWGGRYVILSYVQIFRTTQNTMS